MESWEWMAKWIKETYGDNLLKQSADIAQECLIKSEQALKQFALIRTDFLEMPTGKIDPNNFKAMTAFLVYHWDAGQMAGISLSNALCGQYNVGLTLLRSYLELIFKGLLFQCLAQRKFRKNPSRVLKPTDSVNFLICNLSAEITETQVNDANLEKNTIGVFDVLRGHWMQEFKLEFNSIVRQVTDWDIVEGFDEEQSEIIRHLYSQLSLNVHERVEYTNSGRLIEEDRDLFESPAPILKKSLLEFLDDFHLAIETGVIMVLNQLAHYIPRERFRDKSRQLSFLRLIDHPFSG